MYGRSVAVRVKRDQRTGEYVGALAMCYTDRNGKACGWVSFHASYDIVCADAKGHKH